MRAINNLTEHLHVYYNDPNGEVLSQVREVFYVVI